jgi:hypothetical protein
MAASTLPIAAEPAEPNAPNALPTIPARGETRPARAMSLVEKAPRIEKSSIDQSPVRDVGF